ncbi:MAG: hypothetical protein J7M39_04100, partial [Anaerolineae bacterium]|nr:hypothetical protein [Anaerolineae bacterium]
VNAPANCRPDARVGAYDRPQTAWGFTQTGPWRWSDTLARAYTHPVKLEEERCPKKIFEILMLLRQL